MDATLLINACKELGYPVRSYSGRGMYGKYCVGIELDRGDSAFKLALHLSSELGDSAHFLNDLDIRQDSLGLGTILYFPYVEWPKDMPEDDEEFENEEND